MTFIIWKHRILYCHLNKFRHRRRAKMNFYIDFNIKTNIKRTIWYWKFYVTVFSTGNKFIILNMFEHLDARIRMYTVSMLLMNVHLWIKFGILYPKDTWRRTFDARKNILFLFIQEYRLQIHIFWICNIKKFLNYISRARSAFSTYKIFWYALLVS